MCELKTFEQVKSSLKNNDSIVFATPIVVKGGSSLFAGKKTIHAMYVAGMLRFVDDDRFFAGGHRALRISQIREDQQVIV